MIVIKFRSQDVVVNCHHGRCALGPGFKRTLPPHPVLDVWGAALREPVSFNHQHVSTPFRLYSSHWKSRQMLLKT